MSLKRMPTEGVLFYPHCSAGSDRGLEITQRHATNHRDGNKTRSLKGALTTAQCCLLGLMQWGLAEPAPAPGGEPRGVPFASNSCQCKAVGWAGGQSPQAADWPAEPFQRGPRAGKGQLQQLTSQPTAPHSLPTPLKYPLNGRSVQQPIDFFFLAVINQTSGGKGGITWDRNPKGKHLHQPRTSLTTA